MGRFKFRLWLDDEMLYLGKGDLGSLAWDLDSAGIDTSGSGRGAMLWTGLLDKNGVEIYEGDIVKYQLGKYKEDNGDYSPNNWEMFDELAEIVYDGNKGRFKRKDRFHDFIDTPECEVIGNIYENPELLEKL